MVEKHQSLCISSKKYKKCMQMEYKIYCKREFTEKR